MRMRKKPWAGPYLEKAPQVVENPAANKGRWAQLLGQADLHVEIGSGKGDYCLQMAALYPESAWIAIERDPSASAVALKKGDGVLPENMLWIVAEAAALSEWFEAGEISVLHLNFSDPWPKKPHAKRRLTSPVFLPVYLTLLKPDGEIRLKTDNAGFFEYSVLQCEGYPLTMTDFSVDFRRIAQRSDAISEYEARFMGLGQPIYRAVWRKR
ncbi:MAG: tRNA (guanosine(46)-N7)-methyltransferase TrmB [Erysipelotrichaceae bacterium]